MFREQTWPRCWNVRLHATTLEQDWQKPSLHVLLCSVCSPQKSAWPNGYEVKVLQLSKNRFKLPVSHKNAPHLCKLDSGETLVVVPLHCHQLTTDRQMELCGLNNNMMARLVFDEDWKGHFQERNYGSLFFARRAQLRRCKIELSMRPGCCAVCSEDERSFVVKFHRRMTCDAEMYPLLKPCTVVTCQPRESCLKMV